MDAGLELRVRVDRDALDLLLGRGVRSLLERLVDGEAVAVGRPALEAIVESHGLCPTEELSPLPGLHRFLRKEGFGHLPH
jgi:hypothetical protein